MDSAQLRSERTIWVLWVLVYIVAIFINNFFLNFGFQGLSGYSYLLILLGQWLILRRLGPHSFSWVVLTVVGSLSSNVAMAILGITVMFLRLVFLGTVIGVMQWLFLRRRYQRAGWWIPATVLAVVVQSSSGSDFIGFGIAGVITATVLILLLRRPVGGETSEELLAE